VKPKVKHEDALRSALQNLLAATDRRVGWTLIPDLTTGSIRPEGTFRDDYYLEHGYWEAKDTRDNLQTEIQKKIARGYPHTNIIFEDPQPAYRSQNGQVALQVDLTQPQQLINLLVPFFSYTEPAHEDFNTAVEEFKQRVPDLAYGLVKIQEAQKTNTNFQKAFESFFALCKNSVHPNFCVEAVDAMLAQHLLTERLIRTIFDNPACTRRQVIAREGEKVSDARGDLYAHRRPAMLAGGPAAGRWGHEWSFGECFPFLRFAQMAYTRAPGTDPFVRDDLRRAPTKGAANDANAQSTSTSTARGLPTRSCRARQGTRSSGVLPGTESTPQRAVGRTADPDV